MHYTPKEVYEYVAQQTKDPIVEWKTCEVSGVQFPIYQSDLEFYDKVSPVLQGVKYQIPAPKLCPEERKRRRMARRNDNAFYRRTCNATGKQVVSIFSENSPHKVYHRKFWASDERDPLKYGITMDYDKTFFETFKVLNINTPKPSLQFFDSMENCDYCNYGSFSKSCYLSTGVFHSESCFYSTFPIRCNSDLDWYFNISCESTYRSIHCNDCYEVFFSDHAQHSKKSSHLSFCNNCEYCFGCVNLSYKKYHILNRPYSKEQYEAFIRRIKKDPEFRIKVIEKYEQLRNLLPRKSLEENMGEGNFSNYVQNGKNNVFCSVVLEGNWNKYSSYVVVESPSFDVYGGNGSFFLEACWVGGTKSAFVFNSVPVENCYYSLYLTNCKYCFWCIGLKNKQYCILNKQYTKEEYEQEVARIIAHMQKNNEWWEFFPIKDSLFGYNETVAQRHLPLTAQEAKQLNYPRQNEESVATLPQGVEANPAENLPENIEEIDESILEKVLLCAKTRRPYRIIKQELAFYKKFGLPIPRYHQDERKKMLLEKGMGEVFDLTTCDQCKKEVLYVRHPSEKRKIYCEECYQKSF